MTYKFSSKSFEKIFTCHIDLQNICAEVIKQIDCTVLVGYRGREAQEKAYIEKKSKRVWPTSSHNRSPSKAIDIAPYPIDWDNYKRFYYFAGIFMGVAAQLKERGIISHEVRWGGDWDSDNDLDDQSFNDLVHFELKEEL